MEQNGNITRWSLPTADAHILTANGNPYGNPPDVARYIRYALKERGVQEFLQRGTENEMRSVHILFCAKVSDGSLSKVRGEEMSLLTFSAMKIAEKLRKLTGQNWVPFEPEPKETAMAA